MSQCVLIRRLATASALALACIVLGAASADAATVGILPPRNPAADCDAAGLSPWFTLRGLDACRAREGVGPLVLPSNWSALSDGEQLFVLADLERVNRGLAPIVGLSPALNALATAGAQNGTDPPFPNGGYSGGGGLWFGGGSTVAADYAWMYDDGQNGLDINSACADSGGSLCWLHRDITLWKGARGALVAGAGAANGSQALEVLSGYSTSGLSFTWAHELRYFSKAPGVEPLQPAARTAEGIRRLRKHRRHHRHRRHRRTGSGITITVG